MLCPRRRLTPLSALLLATLVLALALIALGGAVRATDSGLACPDWPWCYGKVIPRQADIPDSSGFTLWNVWLEHSHRLTAGLVGLLVAALGVWVLLRHRDRTRLLWPVVAAGVAVVAQATLGALVVLNLLRAELVTAHLGMAMVVVASLVVAFEESLTAGTATQPRRQVAQTGSPPERRVRNLALLTAAVSLVQILVGGHVTGLGAGLVYGTNPLLFDGAVLPAVGSEAEAYHVAHRLLAYALALCVVWHWLEVRRSRCRLGADAAGTAIGPFLTRVSTLLVLLVGVQVALGFSNLVFGTPPAIVTLHLAVASWIWVGAVVAVLATRPVAQTRSDV